MASSRLVLGLALLAGCNALLGIVERDERTGASEAVGGGAVTMGSGGAITSGGGAVGGAGGEVSTAGGGVPAVSWVRAFESALVARGNAVAAFADGSVIAVGEARAPIAIGDDEWQSVGVDTLIIKLSATGDVAWSHVTENPKADVALGAATRSSGAAMIAGAFAAVIGVPPFNVQCDAAGDPQQGYLLELAGDDATPTVLKQFCGSALVRALKVAAAPDDGTFLTGTFDVDVDLGDGDVLTHGAGGGGSAGAGAGTSAYAARLSPTAQVTWKRAFLSSNTRIEGLAVTPEGDLVAVGWFAGSMEVAGPVLNDACAGAGGAGGAGAGQGGGGGADSTVIQALGSSDSFVAKLDGNSGAILWLRQITGGGVEAAIGASVDGSGAITVGGRYAGGLEVGCDALDAAVDWDIFAVGIEADGTLGWMKSFGGDKRVFVNSAAPYPGGGIVLTGYARGAVDFLDDITPGSPEDGNENDVYVLAIDEAGDKLRAERFPHGGPGHQAYGVAANEHGIWVTGEFAGDLTVEGVGTVTGHASKDIFVVRLAPL